MQSTRYERLLGNRGLRAGAVERHVFAPRQRATKRFSGQAAENAQLGGVEITHEKDSAPSSRIVQGDIFFDSDLPRIRHKTNDVHVRTSRQFRR